MRRRRRRGKKHNNKKIGDTIKQKEAHHGKREQERANNANCGGEE